MLFAAFGGCLAGVVLAMSGPPWLLPLVASTSPFPPVAPSFLSACLPLSIVVALFYLHFALPHPHLSSPLFSSPLRLLLFIIFSPLLLFLIISLFFAFPFLYLSVLTRHIRSAAGVYFRGTPDNHSCSVLYIPSTLLRIHLIYINIHIFIYISVRLGFLCCRLVHSTTLPTACFDCRGLRSLLVGC